jgi:hypothetical protein
MECLWKQVYQGESDGSIPGWLQRAQVAGEGGGIAGNVDDLARLYGGKLVADVAAQTCAWRVDYDEIGSLGGRRLEEAKGVPRYVLVGRATEVVNEIGRGRWRGLDGDDLVESLCERPSEEADAGIEVPRNVSASFSDDLSNERRDEIAVHLEKGAGADLIRE